MVDLSRGWVVWGMPGSCQQNLRPGSEMKLWSHGWICVRYSVRSVNFSVYSGIIKRESWCFLSPEHRVPKGLFFQKWLDPKNNSWHMLGILEVWRVWWSMYCGPFGLRVKGLFFWVSSWLWPQDILRNWLQPLQNIPVHLYAGWCPGVKATAGTGLPATLERWVVPNSFSPLPHLIPPLTVTTMLYGFSAHGSHDLWHSLCGFPSLPLPVQKWKASNPLVSVCPCKKEEAFARVCFCLPGRVTCTIWVFPQALSA